MNKEAKQLVEKTLDNYKLLLKEDIELYNKLEGLLLQHDLEIEGYDNSRARCKCKICGRECYLGTNKQDYAISVIRIFTDAEISCKEYVIKDILE